MQLSHSPTLRLATTPAKESYHLLGFTGFCKEHHLLLRGVGSGSHRHVHILVADVHIKAWRGRKRLCPGASPQAYWKDYEGTVKSSRDGDNTREYLKGQGSSQQQTLGKPCVQCYSGLKEAARYACNDAKIVNACARESFVLLACGFERLDRRARQDVALLGSEFLKLDARARQDTVKLDTDAQKNAARLQSIAAGLTGEAQIQLKTAAEKHWSDGALDADLRLADLRAKRRAMEDAYMALQLVKSIHNGMVKRGYQRKSDLEILAKLHQESMLRGGDKSQQLNPGSSLMLERLAALQDAYWDIASALVEADGIDYSNPEELELIIATLLDMDAVDGANSATLLAECAKSPDVATRQALANALGNAPSLWALGNAGMGALQRLTQDVNPAVAAAALKALQELEKQWQMDSKDGLIFRADGSFLENLYPREDDDDQRFKD